MRRSPGGAGPGRANGRDEVVGRGGPWEPRGDSGYFGGLPQARARGSTCFPARPGPPPAHPVEPNGEIAPGPAEAAAGNLGSLQPPLSHSYPAADIYDKVSDELQKKGFECECLGGGRISHQCQDKKIHVYGYSMVRSKRPSPTLQTLGWGAEAGRVPACKVWDPRGGDGDVP